MIQCLYSLGHIMARSVNDDLQWLSIITQLTTKDIQWLKFIVQSTRVFNPGNPSFDHRIMLHEYSKFLFTALQPTQPCRYLKTYMSALRPAKSRSPHVGEHRGMQGRERGQVGMQRGTYVVRHRRSQNDRFSFSRQRNPSNKSKKSNKFVTEFHKWRGPN